jgi:hypothetical protein
MSDDTAPPLGQAEVPAWLDALPDVARTPDPTVAALLAAAGMALQDAGPDASDPDSRVWIVNTLGGPMVAAGSTAEDAAARALAKLRAEAEQLALAAGRKLFRPAPPLASRRRRK